MSLINPADPRDTWFLGETLAPTTGATAAALLMTHGALTGEELEGLDELSIPGGGASELIRQELASQDQDGRIPLNPGLGPGIAEITVYVCLDPGWEKRTKAVMKLLDVASQVWVVANPRLAPAAEGPELGFGVITVFPGEKLQIARQAPPPAPPLDLALHIGFLGQLLQGNGYHRTDRLVEGIPPGLWPDCEQAVLESRG